MRRVSSPSDKLRALDSARWRIAIALTVAMTVIYLRFILLIAYDKPLLATPIADGLSLRNPGLVTIPLSFLVGIVVSLVAPEPEASRRFAEVEHRIHFGH